MKLKILLIIILGLLFSCKKQLPEKESLARVGERVIHGPEFRLFYELDPNFGIDSTGFPALRDELQKMIDQVLAVRLSEQDGLIDQPFVQRAIEWEKRQAMLRALYRQEIASQIKISEDELRDAFLKWNRQVHVRHLFTKDLDQAKTYLRLLKNKQADFAPLAQQAFTDSVLKNNGGDLGWMRLADFDDQFARGIDTLKKGQISGIIKTRWGYHIVQMLNQKQPAIITESEFVKEKRAVERWLKRKKGQELSRLYIQNFIGNLNPQPVRETFFRMWTVISGSNSPEKVKLDHQLLFDDFLIKKIRRKLANYMSDPLIHYRTGFISLGSFLDLMEKIPASQRPRFKTPKSLSLKMAVLIRDELLFQEAQRRDLQNDARVRQEVRRFTEQEIYNYYLKSIVEKMQVPEDVKNYFKGKAKPNNPGLQRFHTLEEWKWDQAQKQLHNKLQKLNIEIKINNDSLLQENKRIDWNRPIRMFMIRKPS